MPITAWRILLASSEPCPGIYIALWARHGTARSLLCLTCDLSMFFGRPESPKQTLIIRAALSCIGQGSDAELGMNFLNGLRSRVERQDKISKHKWSPIQLSCRQFQKDLEVEIVQPAQHWRWLMADGKGSLIAVLVRS